MNSKQTTRAKSNGARRSGRRAPVYETCPIKRPRRTKAALASLRDALYDIVEEIHPATVRQTYYQATVRGLIEKTEADYKLICRLLTDMRRDEQLPYWWIADNTRWMRKPTTYGGLSDMLELTKSTYRRALWNDQAAYVEIWCEKAALAGVLWDVTYEWDVPLMVTRGYPSVSFLYSAAEEIKTKRKPAYLYYFGDHDPSGVDISRFVEGELRKLAPKAHIMFRRQAVLPHQIHLLKLPTRPTKRSDSRAKGFEGESVELDAIHPDELRAMCDRCIVQHVDQERLERTKDIEEAERDTLAMLAEQVEGDAA